MAKLLSAISILLVVGIVVARGQQTVPGSLSDADKTAIVESVLEVELRTQASVRDFANIRTVSSDNIEFIEPSRLSQPSFTLIAASQLRESKKDGVVQYLLFRKYLCVTGLQSSFYRA